MGFKTDTLEEKNASKIREGAPEHQRNKIGNVPKHGNAFLDEVKWPNSAVFLHSSPRGMALKFKFCFRRVGEKASETLTEKQREKTRRKRKVLN
jgi:hypothetical protein